MGSSGQELGTSPAWRAPSCDQGHDQLALSTRYTIWPIGRCGGFVMELNEWSPGSEPAEALVVRVIVDIDDGNDELRDALLCDLMAAAWAPRRWPSRSMSYRRARACVPTTTSMRRSGFWCSPAPSSYAVPRAS